MRKAFIMKLNPGCEEEYEKRHNPVWDDLKAVLKEHGVGNYSIFLDKESLQLFAYVEIKNEDQWNKIAETEACRRWWDFMRDIMSVNSDNSPQSKEIKEVFHLD